MASANQSLALPSVSANAITITPIARVLGSSQAERAFTVTSSTTVGGRK
jgi:hypothetical protein